MAKENDMDDTPFMMTDIDNAYRGENVGPKYIVIS